MDPFLNWLHRPDRELYYIVMWREWTGAFTGFDPNIINPPIAIFYTELEALYYMKHIFGDGKWGGKRFKIKEQDVARLNPIPTLEETLPAEEGALNDGNYRAPWVASVEIITKWMQSEKSTLIYYLIKSNIQGSARDDR